MKHSVTVKILASVDGWLCSVGGSVRYRNVAEAKKRVALGEAGQEVCS